VHVNPFGQGWGGTNRRGEQKVGGVGAGRRRGDIFLGPKQGSQWSSLSVLQRNEGREKGNTKNLGTKAKVVYNRGQSLSGLGDSNAKNGILGVPGGR